MTDTSQPDSTEPAEPETEGLGIPVPDKTATPKKPASHVAGLDDRR
jgi:hypothetical protein